MQQMAIFGSGAGFMPPLPMETLVTPPNLPRLTSFGDALPGAYQRTADIPVVRGCAKLDTAWPVQSILDEPNAALAATWWVRRKAIPDRPSADVPFEVWAERIRYGRRPVAREFDTSEAKDVGRALAMTCALIAIEDRTLWQYAQSAVIRGTPDNGTLLLECLFARGHGGRFTSELNGKPITEAFARFVASFHAATGPLAKADKPAKPQQFVVYRKQDGTRFISAKGDRAKTPLITFEAGIRDSVAFLYIRENHAALVQAYSEYKESIKVTADDVRHAENRLRKGQPVRNGDVQPEQFSDALRMRGVEYGLWVGQGEGLKERQGMLNAAYDAFADLARVLGIPLHALALGGKLGLALGSRGSGKASAHYEPANLVINMTKTRGAGCLAHEWFHALDHAMTGHSGFASDLHVVKRLGHMSNLMRAIRVSALPVRSSLIGSYWSRPLEMAARSFECYVLNKLAIEGGHSDYLVNVISPDGFAARGRSLKAYPYLLDHEKAPDAPIMRAFDALFADLKQGLLGSA